ncbi:hypothetical protein AB0L53_31595 [Nonomuraea sp. NPDC052129]|uniref:UDP-N-acetylglucosamine 1-carboxyvinyltransferase n=1 Tax=Nonomuraea sp. NPDC052129 TaxID=3154651 RepID=UPI00342766BF
MTQQSGSTVPTDSLAVRGGPVLSGTVRVDGSKNAALPLVAGAAVIDRPVTLVNLPASADVAILADLIRAAGNHITAQAGTLHVAPAPDQVRQPDRALAARIRASYYLAPALLAHGRAELPWPGGCAVGERGMELHFMVYEAFGDSVHTCEAGYQITAPRNQAHTQVEITLPFPSRGTTVVALLRAVAARRPLVLRTPNTSPEVAGLVQALNESGHHTVYQPDGTLTFMPGVTQAARWQVPGDKIEAGTLLCALAITGGHGRILGVNPDHLTPLIELLSKVGFPVNPISNGVELGADVRLTGTPIDAIATRDSLARADWLDADFEPPLMALALTLPGIHSFADEINPGRHANLLPQLRRLGAVIAEESATACQVNGPQTLVGAHVEAADIRTGSTLLVAGLAAQGTTVVTRLSQVRRGHADLLGKLRSLGADIADEPVTE